MRKKTGTKIYIFDGIELIVPSFLKKIPFENLEEVSSCCGAGKGFGEKIVPEKVYGLKISVVCWLHDLEFEVAEFSERAFKACNIRLLLNMASVIATKSSNVFIFALRMLRPTTYYVFLYFFGWKHFKRLKLQQGTGEK